MEADHRVSRRQMLAMSAAAGSLAICGDAAAQEGKRIERLDPALDAIISTTEPIVDLATNLGGVANVEGPLWWKEGGYLLMRGTDLKRWKYAPGQGMSVFKENTNAANGITRDPQGRLVACEAGARRVAREERDGSTTVVASTFHGRRLNFPNDIVVKSDGAVYFTDGMAGCLPKREDDPARELPFHGVYSIRNGSLQLLDKDPGNFPPNGLAFSPDEKILYVNNGGPGPNQRQIFAYDLQSDGTVKNRRLFADFTGEKGPGGPDGMKVDAMGNLYSTGMGGVWVLSPAGKRLAQVPAPEGMRFSNLAFGDQDSKTLYVVSPKTLWRIRVKVTGIRPH